MHAITKAQSGSPTPVFAPRRDSPVRAAQPARQAVQRASSPAAGGDGSLSGPQRQMLRALAWWRTMRYAQPSRVQVASIAGWRVTSGHLKNVAGSLRSLGLIDYPSDGTIELTPAGIEAAPEPDRSATIVDSIRRILSNPQLQIFDNLPSDGRPKSREALAQDCGWEPTSGHLKNVLGSLRSLEIIDYPAQGQVALADWVTA